VAKQPLKSTTLGEQMEVIRRMEGGQSRSTLCRDLNMVPSTVTTVSGILLVSNVYIFVFYYRINVI
jgi:hypothetical protein